MENKLPDEIRKQIRNEAKAYMHLIVKGMVGDDDFQPSHLEYAHEEGAIAWAVWKVKYDEERKERVHLDKENDILKINYQQLKERCDKMLDVFKMIVNAPVPANDREYISWFITAKNIAGGVISEMEAEEYVAELKGKEGEKEVGDE
jgi:hypothetical protein